MLSYLQRIGDDGMRRAHGMARGGAGRVAAIRGWLGQSPAAKGITGASLVWLAFLLVPLALFCLDAQPLYDDFAHVKGAADAWAQTGSVLAACNGALARVGQLYRTWQGTYVAMLLSAFTPMVFSEKLFFVAPLCTLLVMAGAAWYLTRAFASLLQLPRHLTLLAYAAFLTLWLGYLPGAKEAIYWQSGAPYGVSGAMLLLLGGLLLRLHIGGTKRRRVGRLAAIAVAGTVLGGCPYPLGLGGAVLLLLAAAWAWLAGSKAKGGALLALAFTGASLAMVILAPGNLVRQAHVGASMPPVQAVIQSTVEMLEYSGGWLSPQFIAAGLLLAAALWQPLKASGLGFAWPLAVTVLSFGALAAAFVPGVYATGVESLRVDRMVATLYLMAIPLMLMNLLYWLGYAAARARIGGQGALASGGSSPADTAEHASHTAAYASHAAVSSARTQAMESNPPLLGGSSPADLKSTPTHTAHTAPLPMQAVAETPTDPATTAMQAPPSDGIPRPPRLTHGLVLLCAGLAVWGLFASAIMTIPLVAAPYSLLSGQAARYRAQMEARANAIADAPTYAAALAALTAVDSLPALQRTDGLEYPPQRGSLAVGMHHYYRVQQLVQTYGAGHIPQAEWDALAAWEAAANP